MLTMAMNRRILLGQAALFLSCVFGYAPSVTRTAPRAWSRCTTLHLSRISSSTEPRPRRTPAIFVNNTLALTSSLTVNEPTTIALPVKTDLKISIKTELQSLKEQDHAQASSVKNTMFFFLWLIACLSALDRVAMSVAILPMSAEMGWSDTTKGAISSLFSVGYGLCILPAGLVVSCLRPTMVLAAGVAVWSVATMATPAATAASSVLALLVVRAAVGAGESVIIPALQTLLINWTSPQEKSRALATVYSGFHVGTLSAYLVSPAIIAEVGWRGLFELYGFLGLLVLVPWSLYAQDRPTSVQPLVIASDDSRLPSASLTQQVTKSLQEAPWRSISQSPGVWAMLLAHCAKNWGLYVQLAWTPTFFSECYHMDARDSAFFSVLPSMLGVVGGVAAGNAADWLLADGNMDFAKSRTTVRKGFQALAFLGSAVALGSLAHHIPEDPLVAQLFLMASVGLQAANIAGFEAGTQEKAGERWAGLLYSLTSLPAVIVGTTGVYITGRILDMTGQDWSLVFGLNAAINVLGAIAFVSLYDSKREFD